MKMYAIFPNPKSGLTEKQLIELDVIEPSLIEYHTFFHS